MSIGAQFWCWLTANAVALESLAALVGLVLSAVTIFVLIITWKAIKAQANAANALIDVAKEQADAAKKQTEVGEQQRLASERASLAAEKQVEAAIASSAVAEAQRKATEEAARAGRVQSELTRHQILAQLRPVLAFASKPNPAMGDSTMTAIENHGEGIALNVTVQLDRPKTHPRDRMQFIHVEVNVLGPNKNARIYYSYQDAAEGTIYARYDSLDGRHFVTTAVVNGQSFKDQKPFEVNDKGGWMPGPSIPFIDSPEKPA